MASPPEMFHVWREGFDMYVTDAVAFSESFATFRVGAVNNAHSWKGAGAFFAERRKSVRNSDVEVSRTPELEFGMLLGGEKSEIDHVRCVRYRSTFHQALGRHIRGYRTET